MREAREQYERQSNLEKEKQKMSDMEVIRELLSKAEEQLNLQKEHQRETGSEFNIFTVLDRERKEESTHCRLLYELLNPEGSHGCGDTFLRKFFEDVLNKPYEKGTSVYREYSFDDGRIDLLLQGNHFCCPIEVKIDAGDQYRQIERYVHFAEKQRKGRRGFDTTAYYLTLDRHKPSEESLGKIQSEQIKCISFGDEIEKWLAGCDGFLTDKPNIQVILKQYRQLIKRLEGETSMEKLIEMIIGSDSKSCYKSAAEIEKTLPMVRARKMQRIFDEIEDTVGEKLTKIEEYSRYREDAVQYYTVRNRPDPSLVYRIKSEEDLSAELWFQVDHYTDELWYGVVLRKGKDLPKAKEDIQAFSYLFNNMVWEERIEEIAQPEAKYDWWVWGRKLPREDAINFSAAGEHYADLFDKNSFSAIVKEIREEIGGQLESIKRTGLWNG